MNTSVTRSHSNKKLLFIVIPIAAVLLGLAVWFFLTYTVQCGVLIPRRSDAVDLRSHSLTAAEYDALSEKFPDKSFRWSVPLSCGSVDSESRELTVETVTDSDRALLPYLPHLESVELTGSDTAAALALREQFPDLEVRWTVALGDTAVAGDAERLRVTAGSPEFAALFEALPALPDVTALTVTGGPVSPEDYTALRTAFPELPVICVLELGGKSFSCNAETLSFAGEEITPRLLSDIRAGLSLFPRAAWLDFTGCGLTEEDILPLEQELGIHIVREMTLYGVTFSTDAEEIDFSGHYIRDNGAALEELLPELPALKRVIMSDCGIHDEDMDALNKRHEDIRFIWTVYFSIFSCRTDATNFICARILNNHAPLYSNEAAVLRYCPDLIALDLGHKNITDLSFLYDLPHLKYLILVENDIPDITPIGSLQELTYLEIFWTKEMDLTPLANCKNLTDLNICYTWARADNAYETLMQMPQLERLWYCGNFLTEEQWADIRAVMPECEMYLQDGGEPTGSTWREHPHYFEMRDAFEMYYMAGGTNGVDENGNQIVIG